MRGRLHHKFFAEVAMLDAIETRKDPDDLGALTSGFDDDFGEIVVFTRGSQRVPARQDQDPIFLPCNIETDSWEALQQMMSGNSPNTLVKMTTHRRALESMRLVRADTGELRIRVNDRVRSICDVCKHPVWKWREPLYVTQIAPSFGIGQTPDLYTFTLEDRESFPRA